MRFLIVLYFTVVASVGAVNVWTEDGNEKGAEGSSIRRYLPECEAVAHSSARTCDATAGAAGITGVTCSNGASHQIGTSGDDLGCTLCAGGSFYDGSSCGQCPKGYWLGATSVTTPCKACLAGLYNDQLSQDEVTDCKKCPLGKIKICIFFVFLNFFSFPWMHNF